MIWHRRFSAPRVAAISLALLLAGCGGLLPEPPKRQLYRLAPTLAFPPLPHVGTQLLIATPTAPGALDTSRIAAARSPLTLDYYADAEWTDRAPLMVQTLLVEAFDKSRAVPGVGPESLGLRTDFILDTAIEHLEAAYDSPDGPPRALVSLNLKLVQIPERKVVAQTWIRREQKAPANTVPEIIRAFDAAAGAAAQEAVIWTVTNRALSPARDLPRRRR